MSGRLYQEQELGTVLIHELLIIVPIPFVFNLAFPLLHFLLDSPKSTFGLQTPLGTLCVVSRPTVSTLNRDDLSIVGTICLPHKHFAIRRGDRTDPSLSETSSTTETDQHENHHTSPPGRSLDQEPSRRHLRQARAVPLLHPPSRYSH